MSKDSQTQTAEKQLSEISPEVDKDKTNVRRLRQKHSLTVEEFAAKVGVHPRTVLRWELNESEPRGSAKKRIDSLFGEEQPTLADIGRSPGRDTWGRICTALKSRPESECVMVPVSFLYSGPFTGGEGSFFFRFVQRLFAQINPRLKPTGMEKVHRSVRGLINDLTGESAGGCDLAVGLYDMSGRSEDSLRFMPIPGWKIQMACLADLPNEKRDLPFDWQDVIRRDYRTRLFRAFTVKDDVWDRTLRGSWGEDPVGKGLIEQLPEYNPDKIASDVAQRFREEDDNRSDWTSVFVSDQFVGSEVEKLLTLKWSRRVKDLAKGGGPEVGRYPLSMVTRDDDQGWIRVLDKALRELFASSAVLTAEVYADHMLSVLENEPPSLLDKDWVSYLKPGRAPELPSYLRLDNFPDSRDSFRGDAFFKALRGRLEKKIQPLMDDRGLYGDKQSRQQNAKVLAELLLPPDAQELTALKEEFSLSAPERPKGSDAPNAGG